MANRGSFRKYAASAGLVALLATVGAAAENPGAAWLWSARSPMVNRSTEALATGHRARAAYFAQIAHAVTPHAADKLIATQNLCLALIAQNKSDEADAHCRAAIGAAAALDPALDKIVFVRGALTSGAEDNGMNLSLAATVRDNIARAYGARVVDHMAEDLAAAW